MDVNLARLRQTFGWVVEILPLNGNACGHARSDMLEGSAIVTTENSPRVRIGRRLVPSKWEIIVKSPVARIDSGVMSTKNELIDVIESARASGNCVKSIRRQKHDPNNFYMTLVQGGKQVGPVKVEGDINELNRKFGEAQSHLNAMKNSPANIRATAA